MREADNGSAEDWGKLFIRLVLGILILFHGVSKVINGPGFIIQLVTHAGLPPQAAYLVYIGEVLAPLLIIFGTWTRIGALIIAVNMVVALTLVHQKDFLTINKMGGWTLELQAMFLVTAISISLLGAGRFSLAGRNGRMN